MFLGSLELWCCWCRLRRCPRCCRRCCRRRGCWSLNFLATKIFPGAKISRMTFVERFGVNDVTAIFFPHTRWRLTRKTEDSLTVSAWTEKNGVKLNFYLNLAFQLFQEQGCSRTKVNVFEIMLVDFNSSVLMSDRFSSVKTRTVSANISYEI